MCPFLHVSSCVVRVKAACKRTLGSDSLEFFKVLLGKRRLPGFTVGHSPLVLPGEQGVAYIASVGFILLCPWK